MYKSKKAVKNAQKAVKNKATLPGLLPDPHQIYKKPMTKKNKGRTKA